MKILFLVSLGLMFLIARAAKAETISVAPAPAAKKNIDMDGVFDRMMNAVGVGLTSGKIKLLKSSRCGLREDVSAQLGKSRVMPLFDVNFRSASIFAQVSFW